jgi:hypothetical protein
METILSFGKMCQSGVGTCRYINFLFPSAPILAQPFSSLYVDPSSVGAPGYPVKNKVYSKILKGRSSTKTKTMH